MNFTKTLLASSISMITISSSVCALDITEPTIFTVDLANVTNGLNVLTTGSIIVGSETPAVVTSFGNVFTGDINNDNIIQSDNQAILINGSSNMGTLLDGVINNATGAVISGGNNNFGTANSGFGREGIFIFDGARISGGINNSGEISGVFGVNLATLSTLDGGILNNTGGVIRGEAAALILEGTVTGGITNSGTIETLGLDVGFTPNPGHDGNEAILIFNGSNFTGDITNNVGGVITGNAGIAIGDGVTFTGGITNAGTITATDFDWSAIEIYSDQSTTTFTGAITNSGIIENTATNAPALESAAAIAIEAVNIQGGILNQVDAIIRSNSDAINIYGVDPMLSQNSVVNGINNAGLINSVNGGAIVSHAGNITGGITNTASGVISGAEGIRIDGLYSVDNIGSTTESLFQNTNTTITGGINNAGVITSTLLSIQLSTNAPLVNDLAMYGAISIQYGASVDFLDNTGTIQSTGDAAGIVVGTIQNLADIPTIDPDLVNLPFTTVEAGSITGILTNSGTISSTNNAAISVQNGSINSVVNQEEGVIAGGNNGILISGSNSSVLSIINNGTISGGAGSAISVTNGGTLSAVLNFGTINGDIDFGTNPGGYAAVSGTSGEVMGASAISILSDGNGGVSTTTINGDLTFSGVLSFDVTKSSSGVSDHSQLNVTGTADVTGATVVIRVIGFDLFSDGDNFTVLSANTLVSDITTAQGINFQDDSQVLTFDIVAVDNNLRAVLGAIDFAPPLPVNQQGTKEGANRNRLGSALNSVPNDSSLSNTSLGDAANRLALIDISTSSGEENYNRALASLDPETVGGNAVGAISADTAAAATVNSRVAALRGSYGISGAMAGDALSIHGFWTQVYDNETEQGIRDGIDGFDADTFGVAIGIDSPISESINAGIAFSYAGTDLDSQDNNNEMSIDSYRLAFYGSYNAENYYLDSQVAYAMNQYDTLRLIDPLLTPSQVKAKGDHDGDQFSVRLRGGYPIVLDNGLYITPKVEVNYTFLSEDDYSETGAGNLGLRVSTDDVQVLVFGVGTKLAYPITTKNDVTWIPELSIDYLYDTIGDEVEVDSNFVGVSAAAFVTSGANAEQQAFKIGLRLRAFSQGAFSFSGGFDFVDKDDYESQSFSATMRYDF